MQGGGHQRLIPALADAEDQQGLAVPVGMLGKEVRRAVAAEHHPEEVTGFAVVAADSRIVLERGLGRCS